MSKIRRSYGKRTGFLRNSEIDPREEETLNESETPILKRTRLF